TILFGIYPKPVLDMSAASVTALLDNYQHSLARNAAPAAAPQLAAGDQPIKINYVIAGGATAGSVAASGKGGADEQHPASVPRLRAAAGTDPHPRRDGTVDGWRIGWPILDRFRHRLCNLSAAGRLSAGSRNAIRETRPVQRQFRRRRVRPLHEDPEPDRIWR